MLQYCSARCGDLQYVEHCCYVVLLLVFVIVVVFVVVVVVVVVVVLRDNKSPSVQQTGAVWSEAADTEQLKATAVKVEKRRH